VSRPGVRFRHTSAPVLVICDVCDETKRETGAVRVERSDNAGPHIQTICDACALEISMVLMREYFTPDARDVATAVDPPPERKKASGGDP
jgi:hypothetical protein